MKSTDTRPNSSASDGPSKGTALLIFGTVADTTWRMFVPVIGGMLLGLWIDNTTGSKPVYTLSGLGLGVILALLLVWRQIKQVTRTKK